MNFLRTLLVWSFSATLVLSACGSSSSTSGGDPVALCMQGCTKEISLCYADAGAGGTTFATLCTSQCSTPKVTQTKTCTNSSEIISSVNACLAKTTCTDYEACFKGLPGCAGGGSGGSSGAGTGGATGNGSGGSTEISTGGSTGAETGGASGTATGGSTGTGTACADLIACCNASPVAIVKSMCATIAAAITDDAACAQALSTYKATFCP